MTKSDRDEFERAALVTMARIEVNLAEHMRRTEILENAIEKLFEQDRDQYKQIHMAQGALALLTLIASVVGILKFFK